MRGETMEQLEAAFKKWRSNKRHIREKTPEALVRRARLSAGRYGVDRVATTVGVDRRRLGPAKVAGAVPAYSKVELPPASAGRPFAELEMPSGARLRLYTQTPETLQLLASVCGGGAR